MFVWIICCICKTAGKTLKHLNTSYLLYFFSLYFQTVQLHICTAYQVSVKSKMQSFQGCNLQQAQQLINSDRFRWTDALYFIGTNSSSDAPKIIDLILKKATPIDKTVNSQHWPEIYISTWNRVLTSACFNNHSLVVEALIKENYKQSNKRFQLRLNDGLLSACKGGNQRNQIRDSNTHLKTIQVLLKHRFTNKQARHATKLRWLDVYNVDTLSLFKNDALSLSLLEKLKTKYHAERARQYIQRIKSLCASVLIPDVVSVIVRYVFRF